MKTNKTIWKWLQENWRPLSIIIFVYIILYNYAIAVFYEWPRLDLPTEFWDLMYICFGGYIAGRTTEKIIDKYKNKSGNSNNI